LDTEDGVDVPAQQSVGPEVRQGGGEWPDPDAPPQAPAPGAVDAEDDDALAVSADTPVQRLVERALALAEDHTAEADAAGELHAAAGGDSELLAEAEQACARIEGQAGPELSRAAAYLAAAQTI
jgi:hypothetical protein